MTKISTSLSNNAARAVEDLERHVRAWVDSHWDADRSLLEWRHELLAAGLLMPSWPAKWGGLDLSPSEASIVRATLAACGVPGPPEGVGTHLAAPTLIEHAAPGLNERLLKPTVAAEIIWCQLFSEPGAGSDLASLSTRAQRDGDEWVVSGQKVWNTGAATADYGLLLARTDNNVPKHRGITYFVLPMHQPGIEVRPLVQMNGYASFNEVFLDGARVPSELVVGAVDDGWRVALTTLAHERRLVRSPTARTRRDATGRAWREAITERTAAAEPHRWYPQRAGRVDLLIDHARAAGRDADPVVRQEIMRTLSMARAAAWTAERAAAARAAGRTPGPEGSLGKLATSAIASAAARAHGLIAGAGATLRGADAPLDGLVAEILVSVPAQSIAGGTDEIQRSIIGERVLGLPREPAIDRDLPFRSLPRS